MKAISIRQPHAENIAKGEKTIEIRSWRTNYRGDLLIVSSLKPDKPLQNPLPLGQAVAVVELVDCRPATRADEKRTMCRIDPSSDYAWVLRRVRRIKPFKVKGRLGLYEVERRIVQ